MRPKKPQWFGWLVFFVVLFLIVAPLITAFVSGINQPTYPDPPLPTDAPPTTATTDPPTYQSGDPIGTYTPGQPDLNPNDPPMPTTYEELTRMLETNPLYSQNLAATPCIVTDIDLINAPLPQVQEHMNRLVSCLMAVWDPVVTNAGFELPHPSVTVYSSPITTNCGEMETFNASYCTADQQIYYASDLIHAFPSHLQTMRFLAESIIAHEFAHAVQFRTMILMSSVFLGVEAEAESVEMEMSRRTEMQADCFTGLFLRAVADASTLTGDDESNVIAAFTTLGGSTPYTDDHGTGVNRGYWTELGLASTSPQTCNTFVADAALVG